MEIRKEALALTKLAFYGGLLIDGTGREPIPDSTLLIEDGKIDYAGPREDIPPLYETMDLTGKTIIPRLIDTHPILPGT